MSRLLFTTSHHPIAMRTRLLAILNIMLLLVDSLCTTVVCGVMSARNLLTPSTLAGKFTGNWLTGNHPDSTMPMLPLHTVFPLPRSLSRNSTWRLFSVCSDNPMPAQTPRLGLVIQTSRWAPSHIIVKKRFRHCLDYWFWILGSHDRQFLLIQILQPV